MASSSCSSDDFSCPVCLEILCDPATIPCGHTYCLKCIQKHWDKASTKGSYFCPQCRQAFNPRPSLGRNTMLMEALKILKLDEKSKGVFLDSPHQTEVWSADASGAVESASVQGGLYPQLPSTTPNLCPLHHQVLEFYCRSDQQSVCDACTFKEHKGHQVVRPDEEKEKELKQTKALIQHSIQEREMLIQTLPQVFQAQMTTIHKLQRENVEVFGEVAKDLEMMNSQVVEVLHSLEVSCHNLMESHYCTLQQEISHLHNKNEELNRLADTQDSIQFLQTATTLCGANPVGNSRLESFHAESLNSAIRQALGNFKEQLQDLCKKSLAGIFQVVNNEKKEELVQLISTSNAQASKTNLVPASLQPASEETAAPMATASGTSNGNPKNIKAVKPVTRQLTVYSERKSGSFSEHNPAPKTREEMLKYRLEPTLDMNTVYRHIRLSDEDRKATLRAENQNYPEHPDRFLFWRQVLCKEPLAGSPYYYEVEWTGQKVTIGVANKEMNHSSADDSSRLGHNEHSWSLYWSGTAFSLWHAGKETALDSPKARHIGVYLDQQAGVLAFYRISDNQAHQICCVETTFCGALFPGFRFWSGAGCTITICQLE